MILASVLLSATAQIVFKIGMSSKEIQRVIALQENWPLIIWEIFSHHYVISGLVFYGLGALLWLFVLSRVDVSMAYPFVGLGFIVTMVLGMLLLGEHVNLTRIIGTIFVVTGVVLVSRS